MTVVFASTSSAVSAAPQDLIISALKEIGVQAAGEPLAAQDAAWGLEKLQRLIDSFNAQRDTIFSHNFTLYNLKANHSPHTIGPNGDFNTPVRPVKIISASLILNGSGSNPVDLPINIRDDDWWSANPLKSQVSSITTDLYYDAALTLGNCNFWPISNVASPVRLESWASLAQAVDLVTPLGFVQGYWDAIVLSLALRLFPSYWPDKQPSSVLVAMQREAMKIIADNNSSAPRIETNSGMPNSGRSGRPDFNFLTGLRE